MKFSALAIGFFAVLSVAAPAPQDAEPPASQLYIDTVTTGGSGCPAGTVAQVKSDDWKIVTLIFDKYQARIGPKYPPPNPHVNCVINFKIHYPKGWQYTIYKLDYTGYAKLDEGVTAVQESAYWFAGTPFPRPTFRSTFSGKYDAPYSFTDILATAKWVWSPCGESALLNVNTFLDLNNDKNPKASGMISTEVVDTKVYNVAQRFGIYWKKC